MIKVNIQITEAEPIHINAENFPRLFEGDKQVKDISIEYGSDCLDVQSTIEDGKIVAQHIRNFAVKESVKLNKELEEIQRKLEILNDIIE